MDASPAAAPSAAAGQESAVQQELRRLYQESGREMPTVPTPPAAPQRPAASAAPAATPAAQRPAAPQMNGAAQGRGGVAPASSAPSSKSKGNPVVAFFKRLVPGGQSKPATRTPAPVATRPGPTPPTAAKPGQPNYTPYAGQQPRRLNDAASQVAQQSTPSAAAPLGLPPSPAEFAPPVVTQAPAVNVAASTPPVAITAPSLPDAAEPEFQPPLIADAAAAPAQEDLAAPMGDAVAKGDFPDPFPELSESEADDDDETAMESPFSGLPLEEEPAVAAAELPNAAELPGAEEAQPQAAPELPLIAGPDAPPTLPPTGPAPSAETISDAPQLDAPKAVAAEPAPAEAPRLAAPAAEPSAPAESAEYAAKMKKIRDRGGMKGLKGFCPVTLRDERELKDAQTQFQSSYRGQKFHFATSDAKQKFDADPARYAPAAYGADVVVLTRDKDVAEGTLDFAAWFKGKLYLFSSEQSHDEFVSDPAKYASPAGIE